MNLNSVRGLRHLIEENDCNYPGMKKIKIQGKDLTNLPLELFNLTEIQVLDMSPEREACLYYKLPHIPPAIGDTRLENLKVLLLDTNDLKVIPPELCQLKFLQKLCLSNNNLKELPREFTNLVNLQSLHLANNSIEFFPIEILRLINLRFLDLSTNALREIPGLIEKLSNLEALLLYNNHLDRLPPEIGLLTKLSCFWIGNNRIQYLPETICNLKRLNWSKTNCVSATLDGNFLISPPKEVISGSPFS
ncbi:hypothetical protein Ciccas_011437 [Cichlidogyrus casuarinus]|uniref:Disease resistance R13L4/SHOC-2-like LRR domain-containing protein n=1 Tax=Cichlidogyrus casuarinus TaxID=1844966 RepID=A0ABD2PR98_9PLAT